MLRRVAPALLIVLMVACSSGTSTPPPPPVPGTTTSAGPTKTGSPLPKALTHVVIDQRTAGSYPEAVQSFVRISGAGMRRTLSIPNTGSRLLDLQRVAPYTVRSFQRPCRSTCKRLLHPVDACGTTFTANGEVVRLTIVVTPGSGCTISRG